MCSALTLHQADIKDYESTKIMLHFSHFKILDDSRVTCFREPPHQCPEFTSPVNATAGGVHTDDIAIEDRLTNKPVTGAETSTRTEL